MFPNYKIELAQALQNANQYLINSKVDAVYELSDIYDSDYDETGKSPQTQLSDMKADKPFGAKIHIEREKGRADLVSMLSTFSIYCGIANLTASVERAFSAISCFGSLGHELGHNMGAGHKDEAPVASLPLTLMATSIQRQISIRRCERRMVPFPIIQTRGCSIKGFLWVR